MKNLYTAVRGPDLECVKELDLNIWRIIANANVNRQDEDDEAFNEAHETILVPIENLMRFSIKNLVTRFSECYLHGYFDDRFDDYFK
jgi:hypothetical protein